jgi:hypothetical protein
MATSENGVQKIVRRTLVGILTVDDALAIGGAMTFVIVFFFIWPLIGKPLYEKHKTKRQLSTNALPIQSGSSVAHSQPQPNTMARSYEWLQVLNDMPDRFPTIFGYGAQGSGKTTFFTAVIAHRKGEVVIISPKTDDQWGGLPVVTIDDDGNFTYISAVLQALEKETRKRVADGKRGIKHTWLTVVIDDAPVIADACKEHYESFVQLASLIGRSYRIRPIILAQSDRVGMTGFKGKADLLEAFAKVTLNHRRTATLEFDGKTLYLDTSDVPTLASKPIDPTKTWQGLSYVSSTPETTPTWTTEHIKVTAWLQENPAISIREVARRLYPGTDGSGDYSTKAKKYMQEVREVLATMKPYTAAPTSQDHTSVSPHSNGDNRCYRDGNGNGNSNGNANASKQPQEEPTAHLTEDSEEVTDEDIQTLLRQGVAKRQIAQKLQGRMQKRLARITAIESAINN